MHVFVRLDTLRVDSSDCAILRRRTSAVHLLRLWVRIPPGKGSLSLVIVVSCQKFLGRADHLYKGVLPSVVCLSVIVKPRK